MLDRENACPLLIASPEGGMGIEEIADDLILKMKINPSTGLTNQDIEEAVKFMKFNNSDLDS